MVERRQLAQVWSPGSKPWCWGVKRSGHKERRSFAGRVVARVIACCAVWAYRTPQTGVPCFNAFCAFCTNITVNSESHHMSLVYCPLSLPVSTYSACLFQSEDRSTVPPDVAPMSSSHFTLEAIIVLLYFISFITSVTGYFADWMWHQSQRSAF